MASGFPIMYEGVTYHSTEVLYQLARFPGLMEYRRTPSEETLIHTVNLPNAMAAKMKSKLFRHLTRPDWEIGEDGGFRVSVMEAVLRLKIAQHWNRMTAFLDMTGDMPIVEKSRKDDFWGAKPDGMGNLIGSNVLGLLWMLMREEVRSDQFHCEVSGIFDV